MLDLALVGGKYTSLNYEHLTDLNQPGQLRGIVARTL